MPLIQIDTGSGDPSKDKGGGRKDRRRAEQSTEAESTGRTINIGWGIVVVLALIAVVVGGYWLGSSQGGSLPSFAGILGGGSGGGTTGGAAPSGDAVAMINGQAVSNRDVDIEQAVQEVLQAQTGRVMSKDAEAQKSFRRELLSQMTDQFLLYQSAQAAGINPTEAEIDGDIPRMLGQYGLDGPTLLQKVLVLGITEAEYRAWARRQVTNGRYLQTPAAQALVGGMGASPEQVAAVLQKNADIVLYLGGQAVAPVKVGQMAPDFTLQTPDGETIKLSDLRGKPVMVNFWATWCGPCKIEMPLFIDAYNKNKDKLVILGVDVQEQPAQVKAFAEQMGLNFPLVIDPTGEVSTIYQVRGLPTTIFVNAEGIVEAAHRGAILNRPQLEPYLAQILPGAEGG
jgi:peroxiredoxin